MASVVQIVLLFRAQSVSSSSFVFTILRSSSVNFFQQAEHDAVTRVDLSVI
jgi:hypothetical protein